MKECGVLQPEETELFTLEIIVAPHYLHGKVVIHRDVSFFVVVVVYMIILIEYFGRRELLIPTENFGVLQPVVYPMLYCIDLSSTAISTYEWNSKPVSIFNVVYRTIFLLGYLSEGNLLHQMMKVEFYN